MEGQLIMENRPSDGIIISEITAWEPDAMTYVIANRLRAKRFNVRTDWVLRQLKRLEKDGMVERAPTIYAKQICWRRAAKDTPDAE